MIVEIDHNYWSLKGVIAAMDDALYQQSRERLAEIFSTQSFPEDKSQFDPKHSYEPVFIMLPDDGKFLIDCGIKVDVKKFRSGRWLPHKPSVEDQNVVHVHLSDNLLLRIRTVKVEEDYCTDMLQGDLNDGWCIVAVCPNLQDRRPTYILGRQ